jgi:hypothetical protein
MLMQAEGLADDPAYTVAFDSIAGDANRHGES